MTWERSRVLFNSYIFIFAFTPHCAWQFLRRVASGADAQPDAG